MALKGLVNKLSDKLASRLSSKSDRGPWHPDSGPYPLLLEMTDEDLLPVVEKSGVFVLWHRGVRPQWIFCGFSSDLTVALTAARGEADIQKYALNEGVYAAWALVPLEDCAGVTVHLRQHLQPAIQAGPLADLGPLPSDVSPIEFFAPVD